MGQMIAEAIDWLRREAGRACLEYKDDGRGVCTRCGLFRELHRAAVMLAQIGKLEQQAATLTDNRDAWALLATQAQTKVATLTKALESAHDYLHLTLAPCEPDCTCVLHIVEAALAPVRGETR